MPIADSKRKLITHLARSVGKLLVEVPKSPTHQSPLCAERKRHVESVSLHDPNQYRHLAEPHAHGCRG